MCKWSIVIHNKEYFDEIFFGGGGLEIIFIFFMIKSIWKFNAISVINLHHFERKYTKFARRQDSEKETGY
jgi:hypothetical protein